MDTTNLAIPQLRQIYFTSYANFPSSGVAAGDLAYATDRKVLYRWSGAAWQSVTISARSGAVAAIGTAGNYPLGSLFQATDTSKLYMQVAGSWVLVSLDSALIDSKIATHKGLANDHHTAFISSDASALITTHKNDDDAHHAPVHINSGNYTGNANQNRAIAHGLGVTPHIVIIKETASGQSPKVFHQYQGLAKILMLSASDSDDLAVTLMNTTNFYVGNSDSALDSANSTVGSPVYYWVAIG